MPVRNFASRRRGAIAVIVLGLVAVIAAGCSSNPAGSGSSTSKAVKDGGDLKIAVDVDPLCMDPQQVSTNVALGVDGTLADRLTDQNLTTGKIVPWLAKSWDVNSNSTTFTFHLRKGVTFSDGTPFTAEVLKANFDAIKAMGPGSAPLTASYLAGMTTSKVVDDDTYTVGFDHPNAQFLQSTATPAMGIVSLASTRLTASQRCTQGIVGSGPFVFKSYKQNGSTVVTKRKGYDWGSPEWSTRGPAHVDSITFTYIPEADTRVGSLQSGQVDIASQIPSQNIDEFDGNGFHLVTRENPGYVASIFFNLSHADVADQAVRDAFQYGVNRKDILTVLGKTAVAAKGQLSDVTSGYVDMSSTITYDPKKAKQILDDAGYRVGADGMRYKDGKELEINFQNFNTPYDVAQIIQSDMAKIGVKVDVTNITSAQITPMWQSGTFDITYQYSTRNDPDVIRGLFGTAGANYYRMKDPALQSLLDQTTETSGNERLDVTKRVEKYIRDKSYSVPLYAFVTVFAATDKVHGFKFEASSRMQLHDVWIQQ